MTSTSWHRGIGTEVNSDMSIDDQLDLAGLNWEVGISPIAYGSDFEHHTIDSEFRKAIYRRDTGMLLDVCGKNWKPFQNRDIVKTFHDFCENTGLQINHLGSLDDGRTIFASADLPVEIDVRSVGDIVAAKVLLFNYHKVGYGLNIRLHLNRLICTNGMTRPVSVGKKVVTHVGNFNPSKVETLLLGCEQSFTDFGKKAEILAAKSCSVQEAHLILIKEFGDPTKPLHDQPKMIDTCLRLFSGSARGSEMLSSFDTMWGLLNATTEFYNHHSQIRGGVSTHLSSLLLGSKAEKQLSFEQRLISLC